MATYDAKTMAKAKGTALPISFKTSSEVCAYIRRKPLDKAIAALEKIRAGKLSIPYRRFNKGGTGHKPGKGPGRTPIKASGEIVKVLKAALSNATEKGLNSNQLVITHIQANKGTQQFHFGRKRRRRIKKTEIQVVVQETEKRREKVAGKKEVKEKTETKKEAVVEKTELKKEVAVEKKAETAVEKKETQAPKTEEKKEETK